MPGDDTIPMEPNSDAPQLRLKDLLSQGEVAAQDGQRAEARRLFRAALGLEPTNEQAWLWLAYLAPSPRQSLAYLQQARAYHPRSLRVRQAMAWATQRLQAPPGGEAAVPPMASPVAQPTVERPARRLRWLALALVVCGLGAAAMGALYAMGWSQAQPPVQPPPTSWLEPTPGADMGALRDEANQAITRQDWEGVIPILEHMRTLSPDDDGVRQQLAIAHLRFGLQLVEQDRLDEAIAHYDAAIRFYANDMDLQTARRLAVGYRDGRQALAAGRWDEAATLLDSVYKLAPDYRDVPALLVTAYMGRARELEAAGQLEAARDAYAQVTAIEPDNVEAWGKLAEILAVLTPPTPTPTPRPRKRIEVDVSEQRFHAYENDLRVFDWVCSTGIPNMPTRYGEFEILDKIDEAWSSAWGLRMPYWLGIYWAGGSENGIHALPILRDGTTLWAGYLGSPVSFGCIVLDTPDAAQLYAWADVGTPVKIVP